MALFGGLRPFHWRANWTFGVALTVSSCFVWGSLYYAIITAGVGVSLAVNYGTYVLAMLLLGKLVSGERFTKDKAVATLLGFIGIGLIFLRADSKLLLLALGAAILSGVCIAIGSILAKHLPYEATQSAICLWGTSVIANVGMALLFDHAPATGAFEVDNGLYFVLFAVASVGASWMLIKGLRLMESGGAGVLGLLEIVFAVLFGVVLFDERADLLVLVGVATVVAAAAIPYLNEYREHRLRLSSPESP